MPSFHTTELTLSRNAAGAIVIDDVVKAVADVLESMECNSDTFKVVVRVRKISNLEDLQCNGPREFIMYAAGGDFCKIQINDIEPEEAVSVAQKLNGRKVRGVLITSEGPKLKIVKPVISEEVRLDRLDRRLADIRRKGRVIDKLRERIVAIPSPGGLSIFDTYRPLTLGYDVEMSSCISIVDWSAVPQCLDPGHNFVDNVPLGEDAAAEERALARAQAKEASHDLDSVTVPIGRASARFAGTVDSGESAVTTTRAFRKRRQAESFVVALQGILPSLRSKATSSGDLSLHIVDFGSGSGNLCLPLAFLFPQHRFTAVDMKSQSIDILMQRAHTAGLTNIKGVCGQIEQFTEHFDVALALHACGQATDYALWQAERCRAAYIVCPCCVGKLKHRKVVAEANVAGEPVNKDGDYISCVSCDNIPGITHPRSEWLHRELGADGEMWFSLMAKTGDISHGQAHSGGNFNPVNEEVARMCKCHLEVDRNCRMQEVGYHTVLTQLLHSELTSKGDMLAGVPEEALETGRFNWYWSSGPDAEAEVVIENSGNGEMVEQ